MKHYTQIQDEATAKLNEYREVARIERELRALMTHPRFNINRFAPGFILRSFRLRKEHTGV
jgi:hypothetical protein